MKHERKTFGAKQCHEEQYANGTRIFVSYATPVGAYVPGLGYLKTSDYYSRTTTRPLSVWSKYHGYPMTQETDEQWLLNLRDECLRVNF